MNKVYPAFEQFTASWNAAKERQEWAAFLALHPDYADSLQVLREFCAVQAIPPTLYNLECGLHDAIADGRITKREVIAEKSAEDTAADEAAAEAQNQAEVEAAREFLRQCPDFDKGFASRQNADILLRQLKSRNLPITAANLLKAFHHCMKIHALHAPEVEQEARQDGHLEERRKWADQPFESDLARKRRDEKLRLAATAERISNARNKQ